jgi:carboxypeptidase Q
MRAGGADDVRREPVTVPVWDRGEESLVLVSGGRRIPLVLLGLGRSVGTPPDGITASVVAVRTFDELDALPDEAVAGKIVLFDARMGTDPYMFAMYREAVRYRTEGASRAARRGAVAVLVRSLTTRGLRTPHTGALRYEDGAPRIPAAAISLDDADMLGRMLARNEPVEVELRMGARTLPDAESANVVGELRGRDRPDEIVVIGAHIDSWDVGSGAHDDAAGVIMVIEAMRVLHDLDLRPRRTVRGVLFTNEEMGLRGAEAYLAAHRAEVGRHVAAMESDSGAFYPWGFGVEGTDAAAARVEAMLPLFSDLGALRLVRGHGGADIGVLEEHGVPLLGIVPDSTHYFDYHHTDADTPSAVDPLALRDDVAAFTLMTWLLAEMDEPLPRTPSGDAVSQ